MNFLQFLGLQKLMKDSDSNNVVKLPVNYIKPVEPLMPKEHYRVGFTSDGNTTLTLLTDYGSSMTLTMNRDACEQLIKMLRATYPEVDDEIE